MGWPTLLDNFRRYARSHSQSMKSLRSLFFSSFSGRGIGKLIYENEGVRDLPTGETPLQEDAQFAGIDRGTVVED